MLVEVEDMSRCSFIRFSSDLLVNDDFWVKELPSQFFNYNKKEPNFA